MSERRPGGDQRGADPHADADHIFVTAYPDEPGASAANPLWGRLTGEIHEVSDLTRMSV